MAETTVARHVAFVGVTKEDEKHISRYRNLMQNMYRIEIIFYRIKTVVENGITRSDHSDLLSVLNDISVKVKKELERSAELVLNKNDILASFALLNRDL